ncbi:unnamed protein product [Pleuronectes platessa]|uniref:Uncharacterized protein n=1 Tax=Pleuronectes platessa TaxID=8262 RepID=A0A9N7U3D0_PLEPL|nr:unnamed protein product [Pleuronectes platessa]
MQNPTSSFPHQPLGPCYRSNWWFETTATQQLCFLPVSCSTSTVCYVSNSTSSLCIVSCSTSTLCIVSCSTSSLCIVSCSTSSLCIVSCSTSSLCIVSCSTLPLHTSSARLCSCSSQV